MKADIQLQHTKKDLLQYDCWKIKIFKVFASISMIFFLETQNFWKIYYTVASGNSVSHNSGISRYSGYTVLAPIKAADTIQKWSFKEQGATSN